MTTTPKSTHNQDLKHDPESIPIPAAKSAEESPPLLPSGKQIAATPHGPAGGMGALLATGKHIVRNQGIVRNTLTLLSVNQPNGFDCPGCAWPEPRKTSMMEFCENGVKAVTFESTAKRVTPEFFAAHPVAELQTKPHHWLENQGRLTHPLAYNPASDHYEPISWDAAVTRIADHLRQLDSPDQAIFYTSGRTSNEAAFLWQLLARRLGTNNLPDCSNMCHESSGRALGESIGVGKGTVQLEDFDHADAVFIIGQNPGTNHPRMLTELQAMHRRGAKVVTFNPLREAGLVRFSHPKEPLGIVMGQGAPISTHYYQVLIGGDLAALKGIIKHLLEMEEARPGTVLDQPFLEEQTEGFADVASDARATDWESIETQSGLTRDQLREAAEVYAQSNRTIICWAMGLTQHKHAVATIQYVVNLLAMRGNLGKPGAGACPVRGHSNVQGDRTMGIVEHPPAPLLEGLKRTFGFAPPTHSGVDVVGAINAMHEGQARIFLAMGGNFAAATPDTPFTEAAMQKCALTVHVNTKLNRSHCVPGQESIILPCLGRTEIDLQLGEPQYVTVEDSMSQVHRSHGKNPPASENLRSEPWIVAQLGETLFPDDSIPWAEMGENYDLIRDKIAQTMPELFADFNQRIKEPGGFYLRSPVKDRQWKTKTAKARLFVHAIPDLRLEADELRLMTIRSHDQYNTTVYDLEDRYRGIHGTRQVVFVNEEDAQQRGLKAGDRVNLVSCCREDRLLRRAEDFAVVFYDIPRGCAAAYFPETNVLVSKDSFADGSRTPLSKYIPIRLEKRP